MEVAGFAIGVVGLAGLYSTCIQLLGQIESSRTDYIARDLHTLHARLCTTRHLLKEWGQAIGLDSNGIPNSEIHNPKLADAEKRKVCLDPLIMYLCSKRITILQCTRSTFQSCRVITSGPSVVEFNVNSMI